MRGGLVVGVGAAALGSLALVADRQVRKRRTSVSLEEFAAPDPESAGFINADDGVQLYYEIDGPDDAALTVVLVHGFCLNRDDLLFQRRALLGEHGGAIRIVNFDLRSHGRSGHSDADHATIDQLGRDLHRVLRELAPTGKLVLIGHSMGGMTILALADAVPKVFDRRVVGVGLIATTTGKLTWLTLGVPAGIARVGDPALSLALRGMRARTALIERGRARVTDAAWVFVRRLAFGPSVDPALVEFMTRMIGATPVDVIADFFPTLTSHDKLDALSVLRDIPTVVICGADDVVTPFEHSEAIVAQVPRARLVRIPDAGHQAHMERPDLVNPPLLELVEQALW